MDKVRGRKFRKIGKGLGQGAMIQSTQRICVSLAAGLALLALSGCEDEADPQSEIIRPVRAVELAGGAGSGRRWFPGQARATQETNLSFRVAGPLIEFPVMIGDRVSQGDILARIDPSTFLVDVNGAKADLARAEAEVTNADAQLIRQRRLTEQGHTAPAALDQFVAAAGIARAAVEARKANLERAELDLSYTELRAPFSGEVTATFVENFEDVRARQQIVRLIDGSRIEMVVHVPETLISLVSSVGGIEVVFDPFPDLVLNAEVLEIGAEASETTRTYPVTLIMDQPDSAVVLPGMAGRASATEVPLPEMDGQQLLVPDTALFSNGASEGHFVWVLDRETGTVGMRRVGLGQLTRFGHIVTEGVSPGDWVVTAGVHHLVDGQRVRLLGETSDPASEPQQ